MTRSVLNEVLEYLDACGVFVPDFRHAIHLRMSGSYVTETPTGCFLHLGCYATRFIAEWFVMHEVGHVLWHFYELIKMPQDMSDLVHDKPLRDEARGVAAKMQETTRWCLGDI